MPHEPNDDAETCREVWYGATAAPQLLHLHTHKIIGGLMNANVVRARELAKQGQYDQAYEVYQAALAEDPEDRDLLFGFLSLLVEMKHYVEAIPICERLAAYWRGVRFYGHAVIFYVHAYAYFFQYAAHMQDRFGHLPLRLAEVFKEICTTTGPFTQTAIRNALATRGNREATEDALIDLLGKIIALDRNDPFPHQCRLDVFVRLGHSHHADEQRRILEQLAAR